MSNHPEKRKIVIHIYPSIFLKFFPVVDYVKVRQPPKFELLIQKISRVRSIFSSQKIATFRNLFLSVNWILELGG